MIISDCFDKEEEMELFEQLSELNATSSPGLISGNNGTINPS